MRGRAARGDRSTRSLILSRINAALSRAEAAAPPLLAHTFPAPAALVERFVAGAEGAGTALFIEDDFEAARRRVDAIVTEERAASVVASPDAAAPPWNWGRATLDHSEVFSADLGVTTAAYGLADTGAIVLFSSSAQHRLDSLAPGVHVALLRCADVVSNLAELLSTLMRERRFEAHSAITLVRGPSRTADVELTLSIGVHGPKKLYVVMAP